MRCARMVVITIMMMVPTGGAHADIQAICASIAVSNASATVTNVDGWITQYQASYGVCLAQHEVTRKVGARAEERDAIGVKLSNEKSVEKSVNTKAVFQGTKFKPTAVPDKTLVTEISKTEKLILKPKPKRKKLVIPKTIKVVRTFKTRSRLNLPVAAYTLNRVATTIGSIDAEIWKKNCWPRFFGNERAPDYYISSARKRVSCLRRPQF